MASRNYKIMTKTISTFGSVEREDRVKYKGQWGRLYSLEDGFYNDVVLRLGGLADAVAETADWLEEKLKTYTDIFTTSALGESDPIICTPPPAKYRLLFIPQNDESPIKLINQGAPLSVVNQVFDYVDQHGRMPPKGEISFE
jgi:hypothetical protein